MKKLHKLLMTTTAIVSYIGWNIHSTPVAAKPNYLGRWYNIGLSNEYISKYRVFQKDGKVHDYQELKTGLVGASYKWDYQVLSNSSIRVFSLLKETCVLTEINKMQCYSDGNSLGDLGLYIKR
jgi:hypothetical protein